MGDPYFEPDYKFYKDIPTTKQLGIKRGGNMDYVVEAGQIAAYYGDLMVFGESSGKFTQNYAPNGKFVREFGIPAIKPFGVNYFLPTGLTCHNGAEMYNYVQTIPKGDALGKNMQRAMASVGMPPLRGLAPGAVEDMKVIADVRGMAKAFLGSMYPICEKKTLPVGTPDGKLKNSDGADIITDPKSVEMINGKPYQTRWVQATLPNGEPKTLTKEEFNAIPKSLKFDGTPVYPKEKFTQSTTSTSLIIACLVPLALLSLLKMAK